jgi:Tol biopolymer transport system component
MPPPAGLAYCPDTLWPGRGLRVITQDGATIEVSPFCIIRLSSDRSRAFFPASPHDVSTVDFSTGTVTTYVDSDYAHPCAWSPSEEEILFSQSEEGFTPDIWSIELATGRLRNLTNTPSRVESCPDYWPSEEVYLFGSHDRDTTGYFLHSSGFPTTMSLDGSRYTVLTENLTFAWFDMSPCGDAVAFLGGAVVAEVSSLANAEDWSNLRNDLGTGWLDSPSWSPDCSRIGWSGMFEEGTAIAVQVVATGEVETYHPHFSGYGEGWPPGPAWSPDGRILASFTYEGDGGEQDLWIGSLDREHELLVRYVLDFAWSPDSSSLAYTTYAPDSGETRTWLYSIADGDPIPVELPDGSVVVYWFDPTTISHWMPLHIPPGG